MTVLKHPALNYMRPVKIKSFWYYQIYNYGQITVFEKTKSKTKTELFNKFKSNEVFSD